jgi:hypothetical protein
MHFKELSIAEFHRRDLLADVARARLTATARLDRTPRSPRPSLAQLARTARYAIAALVFVALDRGLK